MNLSHLSLGSTLASGLGAATVTWAAAAGGSTSGGFMVWLSVGSILLLLGLALQWVVLTKPGQALSRFRDWCDGTAPEPSELPALPVPFDRFARTALQRLSSVETELTARRSEARRLRVSKRAASRRHSMLQSLLSSLTDGVLMIDAAGVPTLANRAARRFLDQPEQGELPRSVSEFAAAPALMEALKAGLEGSERESRRTRDVDCSDRTERRVIRVGFLTVGESGEARPGDDGAGESQLAVLLTDVTREVEINLMKSSFASSVSHELKTPLCSMKAFLEMLIDGDIEGVEDQRKHLQLVMDETERLTGLIQNLLNLSRLEAGITRLERNPVSMADVLAHLRTVVTPLAHSRKQTIAFDVSDFVPTVTGDRNLLEQAFMNLVSNAIKYTQEGGQIRVRAGLLGRQAEFSVSDTGVGIPKKALDLVFEKFTRVENSAGLQATGTGLGLPLARFVAEAHGGSVSVKSEVGQGSEFTILLPVRRAEESSESQLVGLEGISR